MNTLKHKTHKNQWDRTYFWTFLPQFSWLDLEWSPSETWWCAPAPWFWWTSASGSGPPPRHSLNIWLIHLKNCSLCSRKCSWWDGWVHSFMCPALPVGRGWSGTDNIANILTNSTGAVQIWEGKVFIQCADRRGRWCGVTLSADLDLVHDTWHMHRFRNRGYVMNSHAADIHGGNKQCLCAWLMHISPH